MARKRAAPDNPPPVRGAHVKPFWDASSPGWSEQLPSCAVAGLKELDENSWNSISQRLARNSWFTVRMKAMPMTNGLSPPTYITEAVERKIARDADEKRQAAQVAKEKKDEMKRQRMQEEEGTSAKKEPRAKKTYENPLRVRRIRIYPDTEQKSKIRQWLGAVRFCYNLLVTANQNVGKGGVNLATMSKIVKAAHESNAWLNDIPFEIKVVAVRDMDKARKAHFAKLTKKRDKDPSAKHDASFKYRSKKDPQESFEVRGRDMTRESGMFASINLASLKAAEKLPSEVETAVRFLRDKLGRYFLIVPRQVEKRGEEQEPQMPENIVSLDPGQRTFQTTYDASGLATEWGKDDSSKIFILCRKADKMQQASTQKTGSKRRGAIRARLRIQDTIKNKVKEIHRKLAKWLCENYKVILIPKFETSCMVRRVERKLRSETVRKMLTWSHYAFRALLKAKAELFPWVTVVECDEPYTSKTCGCCGEINAKLGGAKVFKCKKCQYVADRDINGARNILLRYLSLFCEREVSG